MIKRTTASNNRVRLEKDRRRERTSRMRFEDEEYPDFELGDGSDLDFDDPDVCYALSMAKRD